MKFEVLVNVMPLRALLDPQGKAVKNTMQQLGYEQVEEVRIGKRIAMTLDAKTEDHARQLANDLCSKILSNPVMESFDFQIEPVKE